MNIEDLINDVDEWFDLGEEEYAGRLAEMVDVYDWNREKAEVLQTKINEDYPDFPKINVI